MKASVVITTKNRKYELRRAIISSLRQTERFELIVLDDGSSDGTSELVRKEFPEVRLIRSDRSVGYIAQRNLAARLASGDVLFSIDDDAEFSSTGIISDTVKEFDHPRIAAIAIPYLEPQKSVKEFQRAPQMDQTYVTDSFVGTAHALRRDVFLKLGGYRDMLVHQGEESDYCLRMLDAGYVVRLGSADPIIHIEAAARDWSRMDYYGSRNTLIFAYQNVPLPYLPFHLIGASWNVAKWTLEPRRFANRLKAIGDAYLWCMRHGSERRPVAASSYLLFREMRKNGPQLFEAVEPLLSPQL